MGGSCQPGRFWEVTHENNEALRGIVDHQSQMIILLDSATTILSFRRKSVAFRCWNSSNSRAPLKVMLAS
jgi:hypothetical protein